MLTAHLNRTRRIGCEYEMTIPLVGTGCGLDVQRTLANVLTANGLRSIPRGYSHDPLPTGVDLAFEYDSSVQGETRYAGVSWHAVEIKTRILSGIDDWERTVPKMLDIARYMGARVNASTGHHVHVSLPEVADRPTAIRSLMGAGEAFVKRTSRASLRVLGSVGEPINPEAWVWYYNVVGDGRCPIVDTWWQTETGGILITPLPGATALKPGSATRPFFGVKPAIVDAGGQILEGAVEGNLVITDSWPGQMRTVFGDHERFVQTYFSAYPGMYFTGDGCRRDADGYYWITGRVDDVINVSGHRMGTAEVESALVAHPKVAEAAVVGYPHDLNGQGIYAYVTLMDGLEPTEELRKELVAWVRREIGPIASPDLIQFAPGLPKTRSGKIMRRILRKIAEDEFGALGDTSTLADPGVVDDLITNRQNRKVG